MTKKIGVLLLFILQMHLVYGQKGALTPLSNISLLTVGTGDELAAKFGHSAIRLVDPVLGIDEVYGYGTYDFEDPNFYLNFVRGKLAYTLSRIPYTYFIEEYKIQQRWVREQLLDLDLEQRTKIVAFLENNLLPENRKYQYDFLFENCATKIPEVLEKTLGETLVFDYSFITTPNTFRQLIRENLDTNSWSNFGIDLALGSVIDRVATPYERMFLPLHVYEQMQHTTLNGKPLVKKTRVLLDVPDRSNDTFFLLSPLFWLAMLVMIVLYISYKDYSTKSRNRWLDVALFASTGLAGILILFLWFGTDHWATKNNYNILWAFAPNAVVAITMVQKRFPVWTKGYLFLILVLLPLTIIIWFLEIQLFSPLLIFILVALAIRYLFLLHYTKRVTF